MLRNQTLTEWKNLKKKVKLLSEAQENQTELKEEIQEQDKLIDELKLEQKRLIEEHQKEISKRWISYLKQETENRVLEDKVRELEKELETQIWLKRRKVGELILLIEESQDLATLEQNYQTVKNSGFYNNKGWLDQTYNSKRKWLSEKKTS